MKKNSIKLLIVLFISFLNINSFSQKTVLITLDKFIGSGWETYQVETGKLPTPNTTFVDIVCGFINPSNPSLKRGSVLLRLPVSEKPTLRRIRLKTTLYDATYLRDISELMYSTYILKNLNQSAPILVLQIDNDEDLVVDSYIYFEPRY